VLHPAAKKISLFRARWPQGESKKYSIWTRAPEGEGKFLEKLKSFALKHKEEQWRIKTDSD
jgi:hypothetical protein